MKIGIISFAHLHAHSYAKACRQLPQVELVGIYDENEKRGKQAADQFQTAYYADLETMLSEEMEAVIVTSENVKHRDHVIAAARAGKHVLCEKPIAVGLEDAREMIEVCRRQKVNLQTAFPVRFNSTVARAKQVLEEGKLGDILAFKGTNRGVNPGGWFNDKTLAGGGAVMDHTVHVVDVMRWFSGAEVKEVYAEVDRLLTDAPIDDCGLISMEFDNHVFATLDCSWSRNKTYPTWGDVTLEVVGTKGTMTLDAFAQRIHLYHDDEGVKWEFWGDDMDLALIRDFAEGIREGRPPSVTGEDGLKATQVALAAYRSADTGRPVKLEA